MYTCTIIYTFLYMHIYIYIYSMLYKYIHIYAPYVCISQQSCYSVGCLCVPPLRVFEKRMAPLLPPGNTLQIDKRHSQAVWLWHLWFFNRGSDPIVEVRIFKNSVSYCQMLPHLSQNQSQLVAICCNHVLYHEGGAAGVGHCSFLVLGSHNQMSRCAIPHPLRSEQCLKMGPQKVEFFEFPCCHWNLVW